MKTPWRLVVFQGNSTEYFTWNSREFPWREAFMFFPREITMEKVFNGNLIE